MARKSSSQKATTKRVRRKPVRKRSLLARLKFW